MLKSIKQISAGSEAKTCRHSGQVKKLLKISLTLKTCVFMCVPLPFSCTHHIRVNICSLQIISELVCINVSVMGDVMHTPRPHKRNGEKIKWQFPEAFLMLSSS